METIERTGKEIADHLVAEGFSRGDAGRILADAMDQREDFTWYGLSAEVKISRYMGVTPLRDVRFLVTGLDIERKPFEGFGD